MPEKSLLEPRKLPSQERSRKTMATIYDAAVQVFTNTGYPEATTDQIAEKAGVSIGTLYHYFSGKEAILYGLWERHRAQITNITLQVEQEIRLQGFIDRGIVPFLMNLILELVSYKNMQNRLFISPTGLPDTILQKRRDLGGFIESAMEKVFSDYTGVRIKNPKIGVHIMWAMVQAVIHDYLLMDPDEIKADDLIAEVSDMLTRYIFADI
jgi:AcrR family transcriptional regulator